MQPMFISILLVFTCQFRAWFIRNKTIKFIEWKMCSSLYFKSKSNENQTKSKRKKWKKFERKKKKSLRLIHLNAQLFFTFYQWLCLCAPGKMFKQFNFICTPAVHESLHRPRFNALKIQVYLPNTETNILLEARSPNQITKKHSIE